MTLHPTHHHKIVSVLLCVVIVVQLYRQTVEGKNIPYSMIVGLQAKQWKQFKRKLLIINFAHCRIVNLYLSTIVRCICCMLFLKRPGDFLLGCGWQQLTLVQVVNINKIFYPISCWNGFHFSLHGTEVVVLLLRLPPLAHQSYPQILSYSDVYHQIK